MFTHLAKIVRDKSEVERCGERLQIGQSSGEDSVGSRRRRWRHQTPYVFVTDRPGVD